jgi:hypothetical protein
MGESVRTLHGENEVNRPDHLTITHVNLSSAILSTTIGP